MRLFKAPERMKEHGSFISVFLAGSIDEGYAPDWQNQVEEVLSEYPDNFLSVFNPRRDDFKVNQNQSIDNPYFKEQVEWELCALEESTIIFMYLYPFAKSPISLLELGLYADRANIILICPDGFWKKGNVDVLAEIYDIPVFTSLSDGLDELKKQVDYEKDFMIEQLYD